MALSRRYYQVIADTLSFLTLVSDWKGGIMKATVPIYVKWKILDSNWDFTGTSLIWYFSANRWINVMQSHPNLSCDLIAIRSLKAAAQLVY